MMGDDVMSHVLMVLMLMVKHSAGVLAMVAQWWLQLASWAACGSLGKRLIGMLALDRAVAAVLASAAGHCIDEGGRASCALSVLREAVLVAH